MAVRVLPACRPSIAILEPSLLSGGIVWSLLVELRAMHGVVVVVVVVEGKGNLYAWKDPGRLEKSEEFRSTSRAGDADVRRRVRC